MLCDLREVYKIKAAQTTRLQHKQMKQFWAHKNEVLAKTVKALIRSVPHVHATLHACGWGANFARFY